MLDFPTLPDGPDLPSSRQTFEWFAHPYAFMRECAQRFGERFTIELEGTGKHVCFSRPEAVREVFTAAVDKLAAGKGNAVWLSMMGPRSLLLMDGEEQERERRVLGPMFQSAAVRRLGPLMRRIAAQASDRWLRTSSVALVPAMLELSLEVMLRALLGGEEHLRLAALRAVARRFTAASSFGIASTRPLGHDLGRWDPWARFEQTSQEMDRLLYEEIAERRTRPVGPPRDVLDALLLGRSVTDQALRDEVVTLLMAGHETTATSLAWALCSLLRTPPALASLRAELESLDVEDDEAVARAPYLDAVCRETLRIHPTIPMVSRRVVAPVRVAGCDLPAGVNVSACVYLTHHLPEVYAQPESFLPERFLDRRFSPYEFYPFGGGDRRCIGAEFALFEMKTVLAALVTRLDMEIVGTEPVRPVRRNVAIAPAADTRLAATGMRVEGGCCHGR